MCQVWVPNAQRESVFGAKVGYQATEIIALKPVREHTDIKEMVHRKCLN